MRLALGLSQKEVAEATGLYVFDVRYIEDCEFSTTGKKIVEKYRKIADFYKEPLRDMRTEIVFLWNFSKYPGEGDEDKPLVEETEKLCNALQGQIEDTATSLK